MALNPAQNAPKVSTKPQAIAEKQKQTESVIKRKKILPQKLLHSYRNRTDAEGRC